MSPFEEVVDSILQNYLKEHRHLAIADSIYELQVRKDTQEHKLLIILATQQKNQIEAEIQFSDWAINGFITNEKVPSKVVSEFSQMIEGLIPNFGIVYKTIKW